jgi:hypothetical protein
MKTPTIETVLGADQASSSPADDCRIAEALTSSRLKSDHNHHAGWKSGVFAVSRAFEAESKYQAASADTIQTIAGRRRRLHKETTALRTAGSATRRLFCAKMQRP